MYPLQASISCHVVVFPLPYQGHIIPALHLAVQLASRQTIVTFVNTERNHQTNAFSFPLHEIAPFDLRFVTIPDGLPLEPPDGGTDGAPLGRAVSAISAASPAGDPLLQSLSKQGPVLERLIEELQRSSSPVSCLIADALMPWAGEVAQRLKIPWVVFWTCSATWLCLTSFAAKQELGNTANAIVTGLPLSGAHMAALPPTPEHVVLQVRERLKAMENADYILLNSFDEIEAEALSAVPSNVRIWSIGPLIPGAASGFDRFHGSLLKSDADCLPWLDTQQSGSVLYISFGSRASMPAAQIAELAQGIEASGKPFLWVERGLDQLPEGFRERTKGVGRVVKWAPQWEVLGHRSVGAFLTHCGWNSVLEAMARGVAMVCWPLGWDQLSNRVLVEEQWRVGRGVRARRDGEENGKQLVQANEVSMVVKEVMEDEELKQRVQLLSLASKVAVLTGGSSDLHLQAFLSTLPLHPTIK